MLFRNMGNTTGNIPLEEFRKQNSVWLWRGLLAFCNSFSKICFNKNYVHTFDKNKNLIKINSEGENHTITKSKRDQKMNIQDLNISYICKVQIL